MFARKDSVYKELGCDVWDVDRDVRQYKGSNPVICHPPCRAFGLLGWRSNHTQEELSWPFWCAQLVLNNGGVLEHPITSKLWKAIKPTLVIDQHWFGHKAQKRTGLLINGTIPPFPLVLGDAPYKLIDEKNVSRAEREHTPPDFARWLIECCG